jgi:hypothetical protein
LIAASEQLGQQLAKRVVVHGLDDVSVESSFRTPES